jgi:hypothetical protein
MKLRQKNPPSGLDFITQSRAAIEREKIHGKNAGARRMWAILMLTLAQPAPPAIRLTLEPGTTCATTRDAVATTLADAEKHHAPEYIRYVWVPDWISPRNGYAQASLVANSTFSRTANIVRPETLAGGRLVRFDLTAFAASEAGLREIVAAYERLANHETYFGQTDRRHSVPVAPRALAVGDPCEVRVGDNWLPGRFAGSRPNGQSAVDRNGVTYVLPAASVRSAIPTDAALRSAGQRFPAAHLGDAGQRLFGLTRSGVPIIRLDEFVAFGFSTINGGEYYALCGVESDLQKTVARFMGADAAEKLIRQNDVMRRASAQQRKEGGSRSIYEIAAAIDPDLTVTKWLKTFSDVAKNRQGLVINGTAIPPGRGAQRGHFTYDISEDNSNPDSDPNRNLLAFEKYDGGEGIIERDNGTLLYLVWDANDKIIASVPDNVAHDYRARQVRGNVSTVRVFSGTSCATCHDWDDSMMGWQPIVNDMASSLRSVTRFLGDRGSKDRAADVQRLFSQYSTDDFQFREMLDQERRQYQRAVQSACGMSSRDVVRGLGDSHWGYWYDPVTPAVAARDLGQVLTEEKALEYLLQIEPAEDDETRIVDLVREDIVFAGLKEGKSRTPVQWRTIYQSIAERAWEAN